MGSDFVGLPLEDVLGRLSKSGYDLHCYQLLAKYYYPSQEIPLKMKEFDKMKSEKPRRLRELAGALSRSSKFRGYTWEEVILESISDVDKEVGIPKKWFNTILGHANNEKDLYPSVGRFLRQKHPHGKVIATYDRRSRIGIRYADFTVVERGFFGSSDISSVDVKVDAQAFDHFFNQASDFQTFSNRVYLLCTPGFVFRVCQKSRKFTGGEQAFRKELEAKGIGLHVMDVTSRRVRTLIRAYQRSTLSNERQRKALSELELK